MTREKHAHKTVLLSKYELTSELTRHTCVQTLVSYMCLKSHVIHMSVNTSNVCLYVSERAQLWWYG